MTRARALWLMLAVLLVAALLRLPQLETNPPGLHYDEAANAILAADIGIRGERPVFISSYTGKEVLFFYGAGAIMKAVGASIFSLRLAGAFMGLLTVAATYWLGRELLADRRVAVLAAALIAVSFWHLIFSRLGFRAISQPLLQALAVAALFRGLKQSDAGGGRKWLAAAGVFLGLTAYTYLAARLFPIPLALALLPMLAPGEAWRRRWASVALVGGVALLVAAPLLVYFVENPSAFWVRITQVAPEGAGGEGRASLLDSYLRSLAMYFLAGDPYWRFNLPGRPLFNWFWGGLLVVGWAAALLHWRRWWYDWQKSAVILLATVPFLMLLPTALATGEIVPSNLRAIGLIPFIFYLPAVGLVTLIEQLADLVRRPGEQLTLFLRYLSFLEGYDVNYAFVVLLILMLGGAFTWSSYFDTWATRTDLYYDSDADLAAVARYLDTEAPEDVPVFVSALHYRHPTLAFLSERYDEVKWLTNSDALVFPEQGPALYIFPHNSPAPQWMDAYLAGAQRTDGPQGPDGEPLYTTYLISQPVEIEGLGYTGTFDGVARPVWHTVDADGEQGALAVTFAWRVLSAPTGDVRLYAHLYDAWGTRWAQEEVLDYAAEQWQVGETVVQRVELRPAEGTPPGNYRLRLGFFEQASGEILPRLDDEGRFAGDALTVEDVRVGALPPPGRRPVAPMGRPQVVRDGLELLGYALGGETVATGAEIPLSLWWWAGEGQPPMTVRLELLRADDTGVILLNTQPVRGTYPFQNWQSPLFLRDVIDPQTPINLEGGDYRLHLRLLDEGGDTVFTSSLGTVTIEATERTFEPPQMQTPTSASFAGEIELLGYNRVQVSARQIDLELVWRAQQEMDRDYTVFVHLLNSDGSCCLWQSDRMPRHGEHPTSRWLQGEVVQDTYRIELDESVAAGEYPLEVGLYIAENGRRLLLETEAQEAGDALFLRPIVLE